MAAFYHVTTQAGWKGIQRSKGIRGGEGRCGFGVYLWDHLDEAIENQDLGSVILRVESDDPISCEEALGRFPVEEGDRAYYEHVFVVPLAAREVWHPRKMLKVEGEFSDNPWAYHATRLRHLPVIAKEGLLPQVQPVCHTDEKRCTEEAVLFFAPTVELASRWGEVILRFPEPDEQEDDWYGDTMMLPDGRIVHSSRFTHDKISPQDIDVQIDDNWVAIRNGHVLGNSMSHDYDPEWDYELDPRPDKAVKRLVDRYLKEHGRIFRALGFHEEPSVYYVKDLGSEEHVAKFISGTSSAPVIVIDIRALLGAAATYTLDLEAAVEPTLLHEYGHSYMESTGRHEEIDRDEEEEAVEAFAHTYWDTRNLEVAMEHLKE